MYEGRALYGEGKLGGQVGPYEAEVFWDPRRDVITVKFRKWNGMDKKGLKMRFTTEVIEGNMEVIPPGGEYPEIGLTAE